MLVFWNFYVDLNRITSKNVIKILAKVFKLFGYQRILVTDKSSQTVPGELKNYLRQHEKKLQNFFWEIKRFKREINRFVRRVNQCTHAENNDWNIDKLDKLLLLYHI